MNQLVETARSVVPLRSAHRPGPHTRRLDGVTASHCERVARHATRLAREVGITGGDLETVRLGALMHDIGKVAVPITLLEKPGALSDREWSHVRMHASLGAEITAAMGLPPAVQSIVRHHHERWDGTGYPDGLAGGHIPFHARIVCIADVFDALVSERSYRPALSRGEAVRTMAAESGRFFEPALLETFLRLMQRRDPLRRPAAA